MSLSTPAMTLSCAGSYRNCCGTTTRVPDTDVELMLQQNPVYSVGRSIDITDLVTIRVYSHSANLVSRWLVDLDEHLLRLVLGVSQ